MESSSHRYKYIVLMRHGERSDWANNTKHEENEPQLTANGVKHVNKTAQYIKKFLIEQGVKFKADESTGELKNFKLISSPLVRTIQTALEVTQIFDIRDIYIHNGFCDWYNESDMTLRLKELELHTLTLNNFVKEYVNEKYKDSKGELIAQIHSNKDHIEEMDATYPEHQSSLIDRISKYMGDLKSELISSDNDDYDVYIIASHWCIVEEFSLMYNIKSKHIGYCTFSILRIECNTSDEELVKDRHTVKAK